MKKIHCSNCGELVNADSNFCWNCGAPQHGKEAAMFRAKAEPVDPKDTSRVQFIKDPEQKLLIHELISSRHLAPAAVGLFFFNYIGLTALLLPLFAVGIYFDIRVVILLVVYFFILYLCAYLAWNHFYFAVEEEGFRIDYGIVNKRHVTIPFKQVQNVNITRTLLDRFLGIGKIEIESAGSTYPDRRDVIGGNQSKAEGFLPGLTMNDAEYLHDLILQKSLHQQED